MEKKRPKRRMVYLARGGGGGYSARVGYGPINAQPDVDHWYRPTVSSAWRLAKVMEHILCSKQFWTVSLTPRDLMILLRRPEELTP